MDIMKVRALIDLVVEGHSINCGDLIEADTPLIMPLIKEGRVDASRAAVNYAEENNAKLTTIEAEEITQSEDDSLPGDPEEDEGEQVEE